MVLRTWGLLILCFMLGGCDVWERYARPDYSASRAAQVCHPFGECAQSQWVQVSKSEIDTIIDYEECESDWETRQGQWGSQSVSMGLEIEECMKSKGYALMR